MKGFLKFSPTILFAVSALILSWQTQAKSSDAIKYNEEDFNKLFFSQIQTLKDRGCPEDVLVILQNQHDEVVSNAQKMSFFEDNVPFIPVISKSAIDLKKLMNMVQVGDKKGKVFIVVSALTDNIKVSARPYYIYNVANGKSLRGKSPREAERIVTWDGVRRCLTVEETIALCVHTKTLSDFNLWAIGSCYSAGFIPCLWYMHSDGPMLSWDSKDSYDDFWATPSCLK